LPRVVSLLPVGGGFILDGGTALTNGIPVDHVEAAEW
jgi:hypothetical protein